MSPVEAPRSSSSASEAKVSGDENAVARSSVPSEEGNVTVDSSNACGVVNAGVESQEQQEVPAGPSVEQRGDVEDGVEPQGEQQDGVVDQPAAAAGEQNGGGPPDAGPPDGNGQAPGDDVHRFTSREWREIDDAIFDHYEITRMCPHAEAIARNFVAKLEGHLNSHHSGLPYLFNNRGGPLTPEDSEVTLTIIGSVGSGIATKYSDLDVCVRFKNFPGESPIEDHRGILHNIADIIRRDEDVYVTEELDKNIPIIHFTTKNDGISINVDVSYYDMASLHSSSIIRAYCEWEPIRVPRLILWAKRWAETCLISDETRNRLPSYGYTVMLIHFLQRCRPRVLPRLQHEFVSRDDLLEARCFGYFHKGVLPHWSFNTRSVGRLWVEFLDYFTEFRYKGKMISMRTKYTTPNTPAMVGRCMTIENPFDGICNIANSIDRAAFGEIIHTFRRSREVFSTKNVRNTIWPTAPWECFPRSLGSALLRACYTGNPREGPIISRRRRELSAMLQFLFDNAPEDVLNNLMIVHVAAEPPAFLNDMVQFPALGR